MQQNQAHKIPSYGLHSHSIANIYQLLSKSVHQP